MAIIEEREMTCGTCRHEAVFRIKSGERYMNMLCCTKNAARLHLALHGFVEPVSDEDWCELWDEVEAITKKKRLRELKEGDEVVEHNGIEVKRLMVGNIIYRADEDMTRVLFIDSEADKAFARLYSETDVMFDVVVEPED